MSADTEAVDRGSRRKQALDGVFIEAAADENLYSVQARSIQHGSNLSRFPGQIA